MSSHAAVETCGRGLRKDAARNRRRILTAARELFAVAGMGASLNDVARQAGLGVGTVYRRFPSKEDLVEALFEDGLAEVTAIAETALRLDDSWHGFVWFLDRFCELTASDRGLREMVYSKAFAGTRIDRARDRIGPLVSTLVEKAQRDGHLRPDLEHTDTFIIGLLAGTVSTWAGHVEPVLWKRYVSLIIDGMRCKTDRLSLPVRAMDESEMNVAMHGWNPAGGARGRARADPPLASDFSSDKK